MAKPRRSKQGSAKEGSEYCQFNVTDPSLDDPDGPPTSMLFLQRSKGLFSFSESIFFKFVRINFDDNIINNKGGGGFVVRP